MVDIKIYKHIKLIHCFLLLRSKKSTGINPGSSTAEVFLRCLLVFSNLYTPQSFINTFV